MKLALLFVLMASLVLPSVAFAEQGTASVDVVGKTYDVSYDAEGLTVDGMEADTNTSTLTVLVATTDVSSTFEITLERSFFDSKTNGADDDFLVLVDGADAVFEEEKTDSARTLTFDVPAGTTSIDIIAIGESSGFGLDEIPVEIPEEEPVIEEEAPVESEPEPEIQCGPGTVLKDGQCVLEQVEQPTETPEETEPPAEEQMQCGPGTVLKDGACVLDETCGPGTILKDGQCVLEEAPAAEPAVSRGATFDLVAPAVAAFVIAFIIMLILWAIGRASRKKTS